MVQSKQSRTQSTTHHHQHPKIHHHKPIPTTTHIHHHRGHIDPRNPPLTQPRKESHAEKLTLPHREIHSKLPSNPRQHWAGAWIDESEEERKNNGNGRG